MRDAYKIKHEHALSPQDSMVEIEEGKKYLVFRVGRFSLALAIESISKVYDADSVPLRRPGSRVLDIYQLTGAEPQGPPGYWIEMEAGNRRYHVPVENVEEIRELSLAVPIPYPQVLKRPETSYMKKVFFDGFRMIVEIDPEKIDETIEETGKLGLAGKTRRKEGLEEEREAASDPASGDSKKAVLFEAWENTYSINIDAVLQIISKDEIHPVPAAGQKIEGVIYYSDQAIPVISRELLQELGGNKATDHQDSIFIILAETGKGAVGLTCNRIIKVVDMNKRQPEDARKTAPHDSIEGAIYIKPWQLLERLL